VTSLGTLQALVSLQEIDIRIRDLERDRQHIPRRLDEIEEQLTENRKVLSDERNRYDEAEMARRLLESDLRAEKEKIKKWESRLNEIKSNRDYQALSREIEAARKANLGIEDEILKKMQENEDLKPSVVQKEEDLNALDKQLSEERKGLENQLQDINERISAEQTIHDEAQNGIEARWYRQYDMIRKRRDGVAVVSVQDEHCQGCNMGIPPQLYNVVLRGQQIELCPFCSRILYYRQALEDLEQ